MNFWVVLSMIRNYLRKFFAASFYPTNSDDWYKSKGYNGQDSLEQFSQFLSSQDQEGAVFYDEFKSLNLKRQFIQSGEYKLDSVLLIPQEVTNSKRKNQVSLSLQLIFGLVGSGEF